MSGEHNRGLLLVSHPEATQIGAHFMNAAVALHVPVRLIDVRRASSSNIWLNRAWWRLGGHRPVYMARFSEAVLEACQRSCPEVLVATGIAPINSAALRSIRKLGIRTCNYLTDDPFNPAHYASWFVRALPGYDCIFTPRHSNCNDLRAIGCRDITYLPFAYAPEVHFREQPDGPYERARYSADVFFAGGADNDRIPYMTSIIRSGFRLALYGARWNCYRETRSCAMGMADPSAVRKAAAGARVSLCLVRKANRDGHAMRSFELPAMGACMLVEDTAEHRAIFGRPYESVVYFDSIDSMLARLKELLDNQPLRNRLVSACRSRICSGRHTYRDRLVSMLGMIPPEAASDTHSICQANLS